MAKLDFSDQLLFFRHKLHLKTTHTKKVNFSHFGWSINYEWCNSKLVRNILIIYILTSIAFRGGKIVICEPQTHLEAIFSQLCIRNTSIFNSCSNAGKSTLAKLHKNYILLWSCSEWSWYQYTEMYVFQIIQY